MTAIATATGIACAKCSHWSDGRRVAVHHATVADVRLCCSAKTESAEKQLFRPPVPQSSSVINAAWATAKQEAANLEAAQERAVYEAKMAAEDTRTVNPWPSAREAVEAGRYAITVDGTIKFYRVDKPIEGRWAGCTFVKVQASDELYPIRDRQAREEILNLIAVDPKAAMLRYGKELGHCGHCGRTLTDETSRARGIGPVCAGRLGW